MASTERENLKKKYWIYTEVWYCPVCGRGETFKERRYDKKPEEWEKRNEYRESYDYCDVY
jgi:hypothetical protein